MNATASHQIRGLVGIVAGSGTYLVIIALVFASNQPLMMDLITLGVLVLLSACLYLLTPRKYKTHASGIITMLVLMILLVISINIIVQMLVIMLVIANSIYFLFYLGIYTACIDQGRDEGITSEEYIKDFAFLTGKHGEEERGFLKKTPPGDK